MIFRRILRCTAFIGVQGTAAFGIEFYSIWLPKRARMQGAAKSQPMQSSTRKVLKRLLRAKSAVLMEEKTKGRKRHVVVDVMGNLLAVVVHAANIHDTKSGIKPATLAFERYPSIKKFCADAGYRGTFILDVDEALGLSVDISEKIKPHQ